MKKIWVPKRCLESLQVNVVMTPLVKNRNPRSNSHTDQILHMDPSPHTDQIPHMDHISQEDQSPHMNIIVLTTLFRREEPRAMNMSIILLIIMFISPRRISLLTHMLTLTPLM